MGHISSPSKRHTSIPSPQHTYLNISEESLPYHTLPNLQPSMTSIYEWIVSFWAEDAPNAAEADDIYIEQQPTGSTTPQNQEANDKWTWVETIRDDSSDHTILKQESETADQATTGFGQEMEIETNLGTGVNDCHESLMTAAMTREFNWDAAENQTNVANIVGNAETSNRGDTSITKRKQSNRFEKSIFRNSVSDRKRKHSGNVKKFTRLTRKTQKKKLQLNQPTKRL